MDNFRLEEYQVRMLNQMKRVKEVELCSIQVVLRSN